MFVWILCHLQVTMAVTKEDHTQIMTALRLILATVSAGVTGSTGSSSTGARAQPNSEMNFTPVPVPPGYEKTNLDWGKFKNHPPTDTTFSYRVWTLQHVRNDSTLPFRRLASWILLSYDLASGFLVDKVTGARMSDGPARSSLTATSSQPAPTTPVTRRSLPRFMDTDVDESDDAQTGEGRVLDALTALTVTDLTSFEIAARRLIEMPASGQTTKMAQLLEAVWHLRHQ